MSQHKDNLSLLSLLELNTGVMKEWCLLQLNRINTWHWRITSFSDVCTSRPTCIYTLWLRVRAFIFKKPVYAPETVVLRGGVYPCIVLCMDLWRVHVDRACFTPATNAPPTPPPRLLLDANVRACGAENYCLNQTLPRVSRRNSLKFATCFWTHDAGQRRDVIHVDKSR